jgi:ParB family chromosome partitioning protein
MAKSRPSVSSFLSTSSKAQQTQQELSQAMERINQLEQELAAQRQQIESQIERDKIQSAVVPIKKILRRSYKSRREKDPQAFKELVHSIATYGFRGSIWLQRLPDGQLRLIAGETRLDAAITAGLTEIPADIAEVDDITAVKLSRVENVRRRNLNVIDDTEELLYLLTLVLQQSREQVKKLLYRYKNTLEGNSSIDPQIRTTIESLFTEVAPDLEITTFISSRLPLCDLPVDVQQAYNAGQLEYTKAIILGRIEDETKRKELLRSTVEEGLSLSALKQRLKSASGGTTIDKIEKLHFQIQAINHKSIHKLSIEQRCQLKQTLAELEALVQQKLQELESFEQE